MTATAMTSVRVDACGQTDIGLRRKVNQDQFVIMKLFKAAEVQQTSVPDPSVFQGLRGPEGWLFIVADGVGGGPGGELASQTAITALVKFLSEAAGCFNNMDTDKEHDVLEQLEAAVHDAHQQIQKEHGGGSAPGARNSPPGPATTLTMAMLVWPRAYVVHVGDSRAFYLRKGRLKQLTRDQTTGEYMMDTGAWTEEQARKAPMGATLASALGGNDMTPSIGLIDLQPAPTLRGGSHALYRERLSNNGNWDCEVVQRTEGLWLHHARPGRQGCVRAYQRRRALRHARPRGGTEGLL